MPINEINAESYLVTRYTTAINKSHVFRLYFNAVPTNSGDGVFKFSTYTDAGHAAGWKVEEIIAEIISRAVSDNGNMPPLTINEVAVWQSAVGENVLLGLDSGDYDAVVGGLGNTVASAYWMNVFKSSAPVQQFRLSFFDVNDAKPQRFAAASVPAVDDGSLAWLMTKSAVGFCTQDGHKLSIHRSSNTGYNRKLARTYGRTITP